MDFLKEPQVAVILMFAFILAAIGIGQMRHQPSSGIKPGQGTTQTVDITVYYKWIWDDANVLSDATEHKICQYNEDWDYRYNSVVGVVTTNSAGDLEEFAWGQGIDMGMGEGDALLAISVKDNDWFVAPGEDFSTILTNRAVSELEAILSGDLNDKTVLAFYAQLDKIYKENFGMGNAQSNTGYEHTPYNPPRQSSQAGTVVAVITLLLVVIVVINIIDRTRYNSYRRQYYGVVDPPYPVRVGQASLAPASSSAASWPSRPWIWRWSPAWRAPAWRRSFSAQRRQLQRIWRHGQQRPPWWRYIWWPALWQQPFGRVWRQLW